MAITKTRQIRSTIFLDILNEREFLRLFNAMGTEYIAEFNIANNTLVAKLIDRIKLQKHQKGELKKTPKNSITTFSTKQFDFGRYNTILLGRALTLLNSSQKFKGRFGFQEKEVIQTLLLVGRNSVVATAVEKQDLEEQRNQWNQNTLRTPARGQ